MGGLLRITPVTRWLWASGGGMGKRQLRWRGVWGNGRRLSVGIFLVLPSDGQADLAHSPPGGGAWFTE